MCQTKVRFQQTAFIEADSFFNLFTARPLFAQIELKWDSQPEAQLEKSNGLLKGLSFVPGFIILKSKSFESPVRANFTVLLGTHVLDNSRTKQGNHYHGRGGGAGG
jgi:hypothetical protein